ncbi:hypothetical protein AYI70_g2153 [Smittium culicis]|uniref:Uncharacterized protein n=1 Tax=Smittium culicis TaxID=133412 RepID=A0A1R1Y9V8_9FUNG|nr:hypothetical protein AYI70_g2153 [Smittium culicis]
MRALLADIASTVTQVRQENLHKGIDLPGKPKKLVDSDTKPLMDQEKLDALIARKNPEKRARICKSFCGRQQFVPHTTFWSITKPAYVYQGAETSIDMGTVTENAGISVFRRPPDSGRIEGESKRRNHPPPPKQVITHLGVQINSREMILKAPSLKVRDLRRETSKLLNIGNISGPVAWTINGTKTFRTEKHRTLDAEIPYSFSYAHGTSDSEFEILEGATDQIFQRQSMGCSFGFKFLLQNMEYTGGIDAYQCQTAPSDFICTASEGSYRPINPNIFGQYSNTGIREEIWRCYFDQIIRNRRASIDTLPQNQHSPPSNVRTFSIEPCRCTEQVNSTNGMFSVGPNIRHAQLTIRTSRRGPIRYQLEQEAENLLKLVPRHQCYGCEFAEIQLEGSEEPICVSPMELDITGNTEGQTEQTDNNSDNTTIEIGDLVPRTSQPIDFPVATSTSISGSARPKKRKIPAVGKQTLESGNMEDQRRALQAQVDNPDELDNTQLIKEFFAALDDTSLTSFIRPSVDITPVINMIKLWGQSESLSDKELAANLCWLLAVTGFLRASDIHSIDDSKSFI